MSKVIQALNHVDQVRSIKYSDAPRTRRVSSPTGPLGSLPPKEAPEPKKTFEPKKTSESTKTSGQAQIPRAFILMAGFLVLIGMLSLILNIRAINVSHDSRTALFAALSKLNDQQKKLEVLEKAVTGTQTELKNQVKAMRADIAQTEKNLSADMAKINKNVVDSQAEISILKESSEQSKTQIKNLVWFREKMAEKYSELSQGIQALKSTLTKGQ
ncbi:MAG TPA: hypothetical protein PL155_08280 [Candidatus Omnitrophota bacterium]|nr:hypothetical protein [Candidatus Omnitrophota bacterium]HPD85171.1 hypothetical protein [Candidatus Omnitrophota bacterium]HRZ04328.1 hypothetical protein [Candidatus Omnitrophota bacterium]